AVFRRPLCATSFSFYGSGNHRDLHSFPTRRSSDLEKRRSDRARCRQARAQPQGGCRRAGTPEERLAPAGAEVRARLRRHLFAPRSEEHTSELQSLAYLVCRLLLEKKKNINLHHLLW